MHKAFDKDQLSAVYLLSDERIGAIKSFGCLLLADVGDEVDVLSSLFHEDYQYDKSIEIRTMKGWEDLQPYITPLTDVIIVDQYCFSDDTLYERNIQSLLAVLCSRSKMATNIIIFTRPCFRGFTPRWNAIKETIKKNVKAITNTPPKVTFVLSSNMHEHDRTIFTNYKYFVSGDSLNYFNSKGNVISRGRYFEMHSLAKRDSYKAMANFIEDMQQIINHVNTNNRDNIVGDKVSLYLHF